MERQKKLDFGETPLPSLPSLPSKDKDKTFVTLPSKVHECAFSDFWELYPKKKSKGQARRVWVRLKPDEQLHDRIINALERAKTSEEWQKDNGRYIPYPATWLNAEGWEDEYQTETEIPLGDETLKRFYPARWAEMQKKGADNDKG